MIARLAFFLLFLSVGPAVALAPSEQMDDPALEARARAIGKQLRCVVCQNESIDESEASLARDLRHLVRERLKAGDSDAEAMDFIVKRYGDFVLMQPRFAAENYVLWLFPFTLLLGGGLIIAHMRRKAPKN